jgi:hypothetical protein
VSIPGRIVYMGSSSVWFRPRAWDQQLDTVMDQLANMQEEEGVAASELEEDVLYMARFSEDGQFYRCRVLPPSDDTVAVSFVDFGNEEVQRADAIFQLPQDLANIPCLAYEVRVALCGKELACLEPAVTDEAEVDLILEAEHVGDFYRDGVPLLQPKDGEQHPDIVPVLELQLSVNRVQFDQTADTVPVEEMDDLVSEVVTEPELDPADPLPGEVPVPVEVCCVESVSRIWIHLDPDYVQEIVAILQEVVNTAVQLSQPARGQIYMTRQVVLLLVR